MAVIASTAAHPPRWFLASLTFAAAAIPVIGLLAPLGMAPLGIAIGLAGAVAAWRLGLLRAVVGWPLAGILAVAALGLVGALWALDPVQTVKTTAKLAAGSVAALLGLAVAARIGPEDAGRIGKAAILAVVVILVLLAAEQYGDRLIGRIINGLTRGEFVANGAKSQLSRGATVVSLLLWPVVVLAVRLYGRTPAAVLAVAGGGVLITADSNSTQLSFLVGSAFFLMAHCCPKWSFRLLRGAMAMAAIALPLVVQFIPPPQETFQNWLWLPGSSHHRLTIWHFTGERIAEKPVLGWGIDAARTIPGGEVEIQVSRAPWGPTDGQIEQLMPLHPHNAVLQWWLELGGVGTALMIALLWVMTRRIEEAAPDRATAAAWGGSFATGFVISVVSYGFWQSWWQATLWLAATVLVAAMGVRNVGRR